MNTPNKMFVGIVVVAAPVRLSVKPFKKTKVNKKTNPNVKNTNVDFCAMLKLLFS